MGRQPFGTSDEEDGIARLSFPSFEHGGEARRIHASAGGVEEDFPRRGMARGQIEAARVDFPGFAGSPARGALEIFGGKRVGVLIARFPDKIEI